MQKRLASRVELSAHLQDPHHQSRYAGAATGRGTMDALEGADVTVIPEPGTRREVGSSARPLLEREREDVGEEHVCETSCWRWVSQAGQRSTVIGQRHGGRADG